MGDNGYTRNVTEGRENLSYLEDLIHLVLSWTDPSGRLKTTRSTTDNGGGERKEMVIQRCQTLITFIRDSMISSRSKPLGRQDDIDSIIICTQIAEGDCTMEDVIPRSDIVHLEPDGPQAHRKMKGNWR